MADNATPTAPDGGNPNVVIGITGASGALYATTAIRELCAAGMHVHLVASPYGRRLLNDELDIRELDAASLSGGLEDRLTIHNYNDVGSVLASGGFLTRGMAIVPCSANTMGEIASGIGDNLIARAAAVTLKERRRLVVVYREMPMNRIDLENALRLDAAGAVFCPANPGFYLRPQSVQDVVDMVASKVLDLLGVRHTMGTRWEG